MCCALHGFRLDAQVDGLPEPPQERPVDLPLLIDDTEGMVLITFDCDECMIWGPSGLGPWFPAAGHPAHKHAGDAVGVGSSSRPRRCRLASP